MKQNYTKKKLVLCGICKTNFLNYQCVDVAQERFFIQLVVNKTFQKMGYSLVQKSRNKLLLFKAENSVVHAMEIMIPTLV